MALPTSFQFSQSSLQDYSDCPRRFQLRYLDQLSWPAVESEPVVENEKRQLEGQLFHRLIQQYWLGLPIAKLEKMVNTPTLEHWWQNFLSTRPPLDGYAQYSELTLSGSISNQRLLAKYDLLAIKPGEKAIIFDWKTYARRPSDEWLASRLQTRVYRLVLSLAGAHLNGGSAVNAEMIETVYWFAEYPDQPARFTYSSAQLKRDQAGIEQLIRECSTSREFPLTEDLKMCRFCTYRSYCDRGKQAGQTDQLDEDSAGEASIEINFEQVGEIEF